MENIIEVKNLKVYFDVKRGFVTEILSKEKPQVKAVDDISFTIGKGEILSIVGESGSGKTTTGKALLNLVAPTDGEILFQGQHIDFNDKRAVQKFRQKAQMIFQDPYQSLNPKNMIIDIVSEPLEVNNLLSSESERREKVVEALESAGLTPGEDYLFRFPFELSGGQRQRVSIASALILDPDFIVADEPVSMLDVSIRTGIMNLMLSLRDKKGLAYLFITHDLSLAWLISDKIAIMYLGSIMEIGEAQEVIESSLHPYTKALTTVMPMPRVERNKKRVILTGETPNPLHMPGGCRFHPRCPMAQDICKTQEPCLKEITPGHFAACHFVK